MKLIAVKDIPIGFFAMSMTLLGLTLAWQMSGLSSMVNAFLTPLSILTFSLAFMAYSTKFFRHRSRVMEELHHPISMSFFGTGTVSLVFLSVLMAQTLPSLAKAFWIVGTFLHIILVFYALGQWIFHKSMPMESLTPACFIPVVGLAVVPVYGAAHGFAEICWFILGITVPLWIILLTFVLYKLMFVASLPSPLLPTLFIFLAPPSIIFVNYMTLSGNDLNFFSKSVYAMALFFALLLLSKIRFFKLPFTMGHWAFTFPVIAFSMATMLMGKIVKNTLVLYAGYGVLVCATLLVFSVLTLTVTRVILVPAKEISS